MPQFTGHLNKTPYIGQTSIENFHLEKVLRAFHAYVCEG